MLAASRKACIAFSSSLASGAMNGSLMHGAYAEVVLISLIASTEADTDRLKKEATELYLRRLSFYCSSFASALEKAAVVPVSSEKFFGMSRGSLL